MYIYYFCQFHLFSLFSPVVACASRISIKAIKTLVQEIVETIPPKVGCDVNYISSSVLDVNYYDLDDFIKDVLPSCIFIKISAGEYGSTKIFNTRNYNYTKNLVKNIVDSIRVVVNNNSDTDMTFTGVKKLRPRKLNDGTPENYFIDFIIETNLIFMKDCFYLRVMGGRSLARLAVSLLN